MAQSTTNPQSKSSNALFLCLAAVVAVVIVLAIVGFLFLTPPAEIIEGQAEATSVRVSGKLPGRVVEFYVGEGDDVRQGDTLVHIHSSLAEAKLMQAEGMKQVATSQNQKVDAGTRKQIVQAAYDLWQQAPATLLRLPTATAWKCCAASLIPAPAPQRTGRPCGRSLP